MFGLYSVECELVLAGYLDMIHMKTDKDSLGGVVCLISAARLDVGKERFHCNCFNGLCPVQSAERVKLKCRSDKEMRLKDPGCEAFQVGRILDTEL